MTLRHLFIAAAMSTAAAFVVMPISEGHAETLAQKQAAQAARDAAQAKADAATQAAAQKKGIGLPSKPVQGRSISNSAAIPKPKPR